MADPVPTRLVRVEETRALIGGGMAPQRGRSLCAVIYMPETGHSCPERAAYVVWLAQDPSHPPDVLCPKHAAQWRAAGAVHRITTL